MNILQQSHQSPSQRCLAFLSSRWPHRKLVGFFLAAALEKRPRTIRYGARFYPDQPRTWSFWPRSNKRFAYLSVIKGLRWRRFVAGNAPFKFVKHVQPRHKQTIYPVVLRPALVRAAAGAVVVLKLFRSHIRYYFQNYVRNCFLYYIGNCNRNSLAAWFVVRRRAKTKSTCTKANFGAD
jgi:hypothetical protein